MARPGSSISELGRRNRVAALFFVRKGIDECYKSDPHCVFFTIGKPVAAIILAILVAAQNSLDLETIIS
ncbi:hypothetical protein C7U61_11430 [Rhizobium sp. JAB6]|nr:hypothetical protein C7U61_11430 [Rhizobium sp. JAB6]